MKTLAIHGGARALEPLAKLMLQHPRRPAALLSRADNQQLAFVRGGRRHAPQHRVRAHGRVGLTAIWHGFGCKMNIDSAVFYGQLALLTVMYVAGPLMLVALVVGSIVSVFQTLTQIRQRFAVHLPLYN